MTATTPGREIVQIVEIVQPLCSRVYGVSPCTASGTDDEKCYNTRATCQDTANFALGTPLSLFFSRGHVAEQTVNLSKIIEISSIPAQNNSTWTLRSFDASAYIGKSVRLIIRYQSGSNFEGDAQFDDFTIGSTTYDPENGIEGFERNSDAGSTVDDYSLVSWEALQNGAVDGLMNRDSGGTSSAGTGNASGNTGNFYFYAESSGIGSPNKQYWLRSPKTVLDSGTVSFYSAQNGANCGPITAYLEILPETPNYIIPSLVSVSTSPTRINLAGANPDAQGLGNRALCSIVLSDHQHTDRLVDPYLSGRSWDPLSRDRGSFWTRWLVRNKYRTNIIVKIYEGYAGQTLAQMTVRQYFLQSVSGPSNGRITIQAKDILARIEERKAQAPVASPGELYAAITNSQTSVEVAGAQTSDYDASGTLRIGDELMTYSSVSTSTNGITFTITNRGSDGTTPAAHDAEAAVQQCLRYTNELFYDILEDLLETYGGIDASYLDTSGWQTEIDTYLPSYQLSAIITEPTSVAELVSQLQEQALVYVWWDERDALIKIKGVRGIDEEPGALTDASHILADSVSFTEMPRQRASQVWVWYNRDNFVRPIDDAKSYANLAINADLESETDELYGEKSIRKIFGRWLPTAGLAETTGSKIIRGYSETPTQIRFRLDAKDRQYWIGDAVTISHYLDVDQYGNRRIRTWTITSAEEIVPGEVVEYHAQDTTLLGRINFVMASGAADYPGYDTAPFKNCYVGDANGLLSDGQESGKIS